MRFCKRHKKALIITASITAGVVAISGISLYLIRQKPIRIVFSSYDIVDNGKNIDNKEVFKKKDTVGNLIVVSHGYQQLDSVIMATEIVTSRNKSCNSIVAAWMPSMQFCVNYVFPIVCPDRSVNIIFTKYKNSKESTTEKIIKTLQSGNNVVIFLHPKQINSGIYYIATKTKCNIILGRITTNSSIKKYDSSSDKYRKNYILHCFFKHLSLEYDTFENPNEIETSTEYMSRLNDALFL